MIPVSLKLSNFTSYGESTPELDFNKFHMAAISGQNGAGKSSLLDSITWCLWGWSRAGDSADQLIRLGANDMSVEFSFELDGNYFTVKRRRILKGGGSTVLELWSGLANAPIHNLTEGTIKATQQKLIDTLHLTFETFTNSSFLRQGHADEFTTKGPSERKRILADILGLNHYDLLEEKARDKVKEAQTKLQLLEYQLLEIEAELSQKEERIKSLSQKEGEAKELEKDLQKIESLIKEIESERQTITLSIQSLEDKRRQIENVQKEITDFKLQIDLKKQALEEYQNILSQKSTIKENYLLLQELNSKKKDFEVKRSELIKIKDEWASVQKVLIEREEKRSKAIKDVEIELERYQTEIDQLQLQNNHLKSHKDSCPTCGQSISQEKNTEIIQNNRLKIAWNNKLIDQLKERLSKFRSTVLPEQTQSANLEAQVKVLEEKTKGYFEINSKITSLEVYQDRYLKLQQAEVGVKTHQEAIDDLQKICDSKNKQIESSKKEFEELTVLEEKAKEVRERLEAKDSLRQGVGQRISEIKSQVGEARQLVSRSEQLERLYIQKQEEKLKLQGDKEVFEELALAFGKKGIQAMIIETAIPEIEDEANKLLDRLTEGQMKVAFLTQRETKTKTAGERSIVETLDIVISDEMGERPYELYSGGETFRINFAIRLALSKLLTRRAGAKLQFLIIDEGFGTQDTAGRARIVEVLDAIKYDFEKILIITHLEELKEEFPTRIEVSKNSHGSTFEVVGI